MKKLILTLFLFSFVCIEGQINNQFWIKPIPKTGTVELLGHLYSSKSDLNIKDISFTITVFNPVSGEKCEQQLTTNADGRFNVLIKTECDPQICFLTMSSNSLFNGFSVAFFAKQSNKVELDFIVDENDNIVFKSKGDIQLSPTDHINITKALIAFEQQHDFNDYRGMSPDQFLQTEIESLEKRTKNAMDSLQLSEDVKHYLINSFNLRYFSGRILDYKNTVEQSYKVFSDEPASVNVVEPDKSYYNFLKKYNLNNPQLLNTYAYSDFLKKFLLTATFKIPPIKSMDTEKWVNEVKLSVRYIVGFDSGLFYDMLVATACNLQLNYQLEPLTPQQEKQIKHYFEGRNQDVSTIILNTNKKIVSSLEKAKDLHINKTPAVETDSLMHTIISKHKGKVVLVDFWTTWCGPCLQGMKMLEPLKDEFKGKDVVFVYISNDSSPKDRWEAQVKLIGGEQYYFTKTETKSIFPKFNINGIPSYLIYDKEGELKRTFTGFPGVEEMRENIQKLLLKQN